MRAGKRAARREVQKHRIYRRRLLGLAKNHSTKGLGENKQQDPAQSVTTRTHNFTFSLAAVSSGSPPCSAVSFEALFGTFG
jgi:hypothetical protein